MLGQVAVEHDDVVRSGQRLLQRGRAVARQVDGHAFAAKAARDGVSDAGFVLSDQHSHAGKTGGCA